MWKLVIVLCTSVGPGNITLISICAIIAFSKIGYSSIDFSLSSLPMSRSITSDHLVRSGRKAIFVLLVTRAGFLALPAVIAVEVGKPYGNKGKTRYQNYALQGPLQLRSVVHSINRFHEGCVHHMITPHVKLNEPPTIVVPLPPLFPCRREDLLGRSVLGAIAVVSITLANSASMCAIH